MTSPRYPSVTMVTNLVHTQHPQGDKDLIPYTINSTQIAPSDPLLQDATGKLTTESQKDR